MFENIQFDIVHDPSKITIQSMPDGSVMYQSSNNKQLVVDLTEADLVRYATGAFATLNDADHLFVKADKLFDYVKSTPPIPTSATEGTVHKNARKAYYTANSGKASLGACFYNNAALCRERAFMLHILFAELGIATKIIIGTSEGHRHAWLERNPTLKTKGVPDIWDPQFGKMAQHDLSKTARIAEFIVVRHK